LASAYTIRTSVLVGAKKFVGKKTESSPIVPTLSSCSPNGRKIPPRKVGEASSAFALPHSGRNGRHPTVRRPDKQWALLAINKDPKRPAQLNVEFKIPSAKQPLSFVGKVETIQFSRAQYAWRDEGPNGQPTRSLPPSHITREASSSYELSPYSLSVIRGKVAD
jgi:hypothetical protein